MTEELTKLLILGVINLIIVIIYAIISLVQRERMVSRTLFHCFFMLICPLFGPAILLFSYLFFKLFFSKPVDLSGVIFSKERVESFAHADEENERNVVPLEEALEVTSTDELRELVMNVVRGDIKQSLASIALALNSEDSEIAHYAASVLQDALNDFRANVEKQKSLILGSDEDMTDVALALLDYMNQVVVQKVFSELEQTSFVHTMDELGEYVFQKDIRKLTSDMYEILALRLLDERDFPASQKWCLRCRSQFPTTLTSFTIQLKLYFNSGQRDEFFATIDELKKSPIVIDSQTLELIRVFN